MKQIRTGHNKTSTSSSKFHSRAKTKNPSNPMSNCQQTVQIKKQESNQTDPIIIKLDSKKYRKVHNLPTSHHLNNHLYPLTRTQIQQEAPTDLPNSSATTPSPSFFASSQPSMPRSSARKWTKLFRAVRGSPHYGLGLAWLISKRADLELSCHLALS